MEGEGWEEDVSSWEVLILMKQTGSGLRKMVLPFPKKIVGKVISI